MRVLLLVPVSYLDKRQHYLGSTKDIACRVQYFRDRHIDHEVVGVKKEAGPTIEALKQLPLEEFTHILIEKSNYWSVLKYLKAHAPTAQIWLRGHNAEFPHRVDYFFSTLREKKPKRGPLHQIYNVFHFGMKDVAGAVLSDRVLAICDWEAKYYWPLLGAGKQTANVPFFLTEEYEREVPKKAEKAPLCLCPMSTEPGPVTLDALRGFVRAVGSLADRGEWRFAVSGKLSKPVSDVLDTIEDPPEVFWYDSPYEAFRWARATCILSDYGRGFKTKLLEAILCQSRVLATPGLYERIPDELKPYSLRVDLREKGSFEKALETCLEPFPSGAPNQALRKVAYETLDGLFQVDAATAAQAGRN